MFTNFSFLELGAVGITLYVTDLLLSPMFSASEITAMLKFFLQGWIVLEIDSALKQRNA